MRTIVTFEPLGDQTIMRLTDAPTNITGQGIPEIVVLPELTKFTGTIQQRGAALRALLAGCTPVSVGLATAFAQPADAPPGPLYFHVVADRADILPWELLFDPETGFCALDQRWPIGRIANRHHDVDPRSFTPPLRVVAVLSAAKQDGIPQLQALMNAVTTAEAEAGNIHLHVISAQGDLLDTVEALGNPNVTFEQLPSTAPELERKITAARPHILHLLCHGGAMAPGLHTLAFAHLQDRKNPDEQTGSVRLRAPNLVRALKPCATWLVVLSACSTGDSSDTPAIAHDLVSQGIPAVAGMRGQVPITDANDFCRALYPEVLAAVHAVVGAQPPKVSKIDWAAAFTTPRVVLARTDPTLTDAWTNPVLYVQDQPLVVFPGTPNQSPEECARLLAILGFWEDLISRFDPSTTNPALLAQAKAQIAATRARLLEASP